MPETETEPAATDTGGQTADPSEPTGADVGEPGADALADAGKQALDRMKNERNEARRNARDLQKQLDDQRTSSMSEQERAVHEAEQRGRQSATTEYSQRLARTEFDAVAGRRNPDVDTADVLQYVDLAKFVSEDGEVDSKAIAAAVERLVPPPAAGVPSFDGGSRTTPTAAPSMTGLIRKAAGRA